MVQAPVKHIHEFGDHHCNGIFPGIQEVIKRLTLLVSYIPTFYPQKNQYQTGQALTFCKALPPKIRVMGCIPDVFNRHGCEVRVLFGAKEKLHPTCHVLILDWGYLIGMNITMHTLTLTHIHIYIYIIYVKLYTHIRVFICFGIF